MAIILPPAPSLGSSLGTAIGGGLAGLLTGLAENRARLMSQQDIASGLQAAGFNPTEADALSKLPERERLAIIQQRARAQQAETQQRAKLANQSSYLNALQGVLGGAPQQVPQTIQGQENLSGRFIGQTPQAGLGLPTTAQEGGLTEGQVTNLARLGLQQRQHEETQALKREQFERRQGFAEQNVVNKETLPYYTETRKAAKAAKENDMRLDRMEELNNKGNLQNPLLYGTLKKFHLDIPALQSADSQEFVKLSNDFLRNAKDIFGARLTNLDVSTFLRIVPELSQTKEGRERIINNMRAFDAAAKIRSDAMNRIIKENNGKRPANLDALVEESISPQLDQIAERFKAGYESTPTRAASDAIASIEPAVGTKLSNIQQASNLPVGSIIRAKDGRRLRKTETGWRII